MSTPTICLINPPTTHPWENSVYFPMSLLALGGVLRREGYATTLWDFDLYCKRAGNVSVPQFRRLLRRGIEGVETNVFGISAICSNLPMALWIAQEIKQHRPDATVIFGGPQPSATPHRLLECFSDIDAVVVGEGEETLAELCRARFQPDTFRHIAGIASRHDGTIHYIPRQGLIAKLDDLPMPEFSLVNLADYREVSRNGVWTSLEAGRGCPFACTFCSTSLMWKRRYRMKSPERILDEMRLLEKLWGVTAFDLIHDNFTTSQKYVEHFCSIMESDGNPKWRWSSSSRVDCLSAEQLKMMNAAGLNGMFFGIETSSARMQQIIGKRLDLTDFDQILRLGRQLGIDMTTAFILGFPEEEAEDIDATVATALHYQLSGADNIFFSKLSPLAGTAIHQQYKDELRPDDYASTASPLHFALPDARNMIRDYPDLFSSFYHIPHPLLSSEELTHFIDFAHGLVCSCADLANILICHKVMTPLELFAQWERWIDSPAATKRYLVMGDFRTHFRRFLAERILIKPPAVAMPAVHAASL